MRAARTGPWILVVTTTAVLVGGALLDAFSGHRDGAPAVVAWVVAAGSSIGVGVVLATRRPEHPIGWLLLANGLVIAATGFADTYANYAVLGHPGALPGGRWAVLVSERGWPLLFAGLTAIAWVFPDGRLPSPRWRPWARAAAASFVAYAVLSFFANEPYSDTFAHVSSPLPRLTEPAFEIPRMLSAFGALGGIFGAAVAVATRLRRSSGIEREQLKWLAYAAALVPAAVVACLAEIAIAGRDGAVTVAALVLALIAVPAAIGIAVTRYRLYEIDRLINRTLVYTVLTIVLGAIFGAVSLTLGTGLGSGSTLPTAAATLAVAVLFAPLRAHAQLLVDRRFDRARYEGLQAVERYLEELREGRTAPEAAGAMLAEALGDPGLELRFSFGPLHLDAAGRVVEERAGDDRTRTPVRRGDFALATVVHDRALDERPDLLDSVIGAAGLAIEIARLRVEVRRRLAEVEASRARIVTAGYEERRRLERDLHDGAQQRLVSIGLALRHVQRGLPADSAQSEALDATVAELATAIDELRELARGVRPAGLDDGLAHAMRELAARSPMRTRVEVTDERFEDRVETAAYFVASEALANAAKYAGAASVTLSATRQNGSLVVCVHDDGVGGAAPSAGSGLAGMTDRVAALGGHVSVTSPPGEGTVVTAELPCGS